MNRRLPSSRLLALLCVLALVGAQVYGGVRGYVSAGAGSLQWAVEDPCVAADGSSENGLGQGEPADHEQVRDEVQMRLLTPLAAPVPVPVLIMPYVGETADSLAPGVSRACSPAIVNAEPPPGVVVARDGCFC